MSNLGERAYQALLERLPKTGTRVRLVEDVERYPHFIARRGMEGVVTESSDEIFAVRMDDEIPGAQEWENEVHWYPRNGGDWPFSALEELSQKSKMRPTLGVSLLPMGLVKIIRQRAARRLRARRAWQGIHDLADAAGVPWQFIVCQYCGAQSWRLPPHGLDEPCPIVVDTHEAMQLKADAERSLAVRSGVQMERMQEFLEAFHREPDDDDD